MLANFLPPSILYIDNLSMSSFRFDVGCIVINFFVLSSIFQSFSLDHGPKYFTRGTAQVFIPLISAVEFGFESFLFLLIFFFYLCLFDGVRFQYP